MLCIYVKFKNYNQLKLVIDDTALGRKYYTLVNRMYKKEAPLFRDTAKYTVDYMLQIARKAKKFLGWEWSFDQYDVSITAMLHKDVERLVGAQGFTNVPAELDDLIHELHYCLHIIQWGEPATRGGWLQIEWFNDQGFPLTETEIFKSGLKFGDIRLQNPHVGHGPMQVYLEKDFTNVLQTCKFHNFVKPGINISIGEIVDIDPTIVLAEFRKRCPEFVKLHTAEKILQYTGYPVVGKVENLDDLHKVAMAAVLELEYIAFDE